jgi:hypothetical protein
MLCLLLTFLKTNWSKNKRIFLFFSNVSFFPEHVSINIKYNSCNIRHVDLALTCFVNVTISKMYPFTIIPMIMMTIEIISKLKGNIPFVSFLLIYFVILRRNREKGKQLAGVSNTHKWVSSLIMVDFCNWYLSWSNFGLSCQSIWSSLTCEAWRRWDESSKRGQVNMCRKFTIKINRAKGISARRTQWMRHVTIKMLT